MSPHTRCAGHFANTNKHHHAICNSCNLPQVQQQAGSWSLDTLFDLTWLEPSVRIRQFAWSLM
jgi:hypothetical protein